MNTTRQTALKTTLKTPIVWLVSCAFAAALVACDNPKAQKIGGLTSSNTPTPTTVVTPTPDEPSDNAIQVSWTAPHLNSDGSDLSDLAGYRIYVGPSEAELIYEFDIDNPAQTTAQVGSFTAGSYYVYMTAYNQAGLMSELAPGGYVTVQ